MEFRIIRRLASAGLFLCIAILMGPWHVVLASKADLPVAGMKVSIGPLNSVQIERDGRSLIVYGDSDVSVSKVEMVLLTHHRRDALAHAHRLSLSGIDVAAPKAEENLFSQVYDFWKGFEDRRYEDFDQGTTKVLSSPVSVSRWVSEGERFEWRGLPFQVVETPGYTGGSVSYILEVEGKRIGFTGDLIYAGGKLFDLYSLQDAVPEARVRGYHGFAARAAQLIHSLDKLSQLDLDYIVPVRGPIIEDPQRSMTLLVERLRKVYGNYLSISALKWYREKETAILAERVLGRTADLRVVGTAQSELPPWVVAIQNSRLLISNDGTGFLLDCGAKKIVDEVERLHQESVLKRLEGIYVTHYHHDHTNEVANLQKRWNCPVYATAELKDVLEKPGDYRLPCLTRAPIPSVTGMASSEHMRWKEFDLESIYFPGQTILHGALLVKKNDGKSILFAGDSFTPTGIDDYCAQNRNFLSEGRGYFKCLDILAGLDPTTFVVNQHVVPMFRFTEDQIETMKALLQQRIALLKELLPWGNVNYGLDEGWARFFPYAQEWVPGRELRLELQVWNHYDVEKAAELRLNLPAGWAADPVTAKVAIPAGGVGKATFRVMPAVGNMEKTVVVTADVSFDGWQLKEWTEMLLIGGSKQD